MARQENDQARQFALGFDADTTDTTDAHEFFCWMIDD
jgi:hypothetical protein